MDYARAECVACSPGDDVNGERERARWMETHRGEMAKSSFSGSGSDHTRSAIGPSWGISEVS